MSNKTQLSIIAVFLLAISFGAFWYFNQSAFKPVLTKSLTKDSVVKNEVVSPTIKPTPEVALSAKPKGNIALPQDAEFMVSGGSPTSSIRFFEGSIKPLDVHVGNTQNFRIVVAADSGIKRVVAEIETDFGNDIVELKKDSVISILDTYPNPYTVNPKDNTLKILSDTELAQARNDEYQKELARKKTGQANASLGQREVWIGSWLVRNVHDKVYHTNFIAYDSAGNQEKLTMTWSDLCLIKLSGSWDLANDYGHNCTIPSGVVDGVANGNVIINDGYSLNLATGATFLWNTNFGISFPNNGYLYLSPNRSSQLKQVPTIYVKDQDNDHYIAPGNLGTTQTSTVGLNGWHPRQNMIAETDCNDNNSGVVPGTAVYHGSPMVNNVNPALTYDWDCSGSYDINPLDAKYCPSPAYISGSNYVYTYYSCYGYDTGGCCGGGGSGGCSGPDCTISKLRDLWSIRTAKAEAAACCNTSRVQIYGCSTLTVSSTPASFCGQSKSVAVESFYSSDSGCYNSRKKYYRVKTTNIGCQ